MAGALNFTFDDAMRRLTRAHRKSAPKLSGHRARAAAREERGNVRRWFSWFGRFNRGLKT